MLDKNSDLTLINHYDMLAMNNKHQKSAVVHNT